jgi:peroxiredoxin
MSATASVMIPLGTLAPDFRLPDTVSGKFISFNDASGKVATVVMFICNHCPYVKLLNPEIVNTARTYQPKGINFIAISSNDILQYPDDGPERMKVVAKELGYPFPYLFDETQEVARAYDAACTPDFYVFDAEKKLKYRGQFDDARPGNNKTPSGTDLRNALDAIVSGKSPGEDQRPSIGCNIKWKKS